MLPGYALGLCDYLLRFFADCRRFLLRTASLTLVNSTPVAVVVVLSGPKQAYVRIEPLALMTVHVPAGKYKLNFRAGVNPGTFRYSAVIERADVDHRANATVIIEPSWFESPSLTHDTPNASP